MMIYGLAIATLILFICILFANRYKNSKLIDTLSKTRKLALPLQVAHLIIEKGVLEEFDFMNFG